MKLNEVPRDTVLRLRDRVAADLPAYLDDLAALVDVDCGSYTKSGVDQVGRWMVTRFRELGASVQIHPEAELGDTVVATFRGPGRASVLLIGHLDTVFEPGTAAARPFHIEEGRAYGPGVSDMKAGLLAGLYALRAIRAEARPVHGSPAGILPWLPLARLTFVANPDEEIGSPVSTPVIRALAADHDAALVLEGARANGDIVSARKGNLSLVLTVHGRAAHAGVEPEKGRNAILEAAHKTIALQALNGRWPGVTCNVGVLRAGTRPNIVADEAVLEVDVRAPTRPALQAAESAISEIAARSTVADTTCDVVRRGRHWPMERLRGAIALADAAGALSAALGFHVHDTATGGASDANTTAGEGVPTLDGLGPIGGLDHSPGEYVEVGSIADRVALLAGLICAIDAG